MNRDIFVTPNLDSKSSSLFSPSSKLGPDTLGSTRPWYRTWNRTTKIITGVAVAVVLLVVLFVVLYFTLWRNQGTTALGTVQVLNASSKHVSNRFQPGDYVELKYMNPDHTYTDNVIWSFSDNGGKSYDYSVTGPQKGNSVTWQLPDNVFTNAGHFRASFAQEAHNFVVSDTIVVEPRSIVYSGPGVQAANQVAYKDTQLLSVLLFDTNLSPISEAKDWQVDITDTSNNTKYTANINQVSVTNGRVSIVWSTSRTGVFKILFSTTRLSTPVQVNAAAPNAITVRDPPDTPGQNTLVVFGSHNTEHSIYTGETVTMEVTYSNGWPVDAAPTFTVNSIALTPSSTYTVPRPNTRAYMVTLPSDFQANDATFTSNSGPGFTTTYKTDVVARFTSNLTGTVPVYEPGLPMDITQNAVLAFTPNATNWQGSGVTWTLTLPNGNAANVIGVAAKGDNNIIVTWSVTQTEIPSQITGPLKFMATQQVGEATITTTSSTADLIFKPTQWVPSYAPLFQGVLILEDPKSVDQITVGAANSAKCDPMFPDGAIPNFAYMCDTQLRHFFQVTQANQTGAAYCLWPQDPSKVTYPYDFPCLAVPDDGDQVTFRGWNSQRDSITFFTQVSSPENTISLAVADQSSGCLTYDPNLTAQTLKYQANQICPAAAPTTYSGLSHKVTTPIVQNPGSHCQCNPGDVFCHNRDTGEIPCCSTCG